MSIETVKLSEKAKNQLVTIKRHTKIENWNVLCRWALMLSLQEKSVPPHEEVHTNSNIEMTWKVFGGEFADIYMAMLKQRIYQDEGQLDKDKLSYFFKLHLHRGISYLFYKTKNIDEMIKLAL
ncbi:DNA sulfur modification protein DndE [Parashewanella spongiae]|uniref:DNA sulfur modification protein DndE n=1 Tax=Parashewanella spongiae TaxID=342950 RepID=A0A3A6UJZ7_9GAMM|nr:DNA sulfur modification protein DndE [Parashewanella spongiae]MCL1076573.1 DNA sulfur modification protein DndE [Parashewanella spongiae]RJY19532.1 DNA sulfur modification protein DndE [Parashewanella spongiae]